MGKLQRWVLLLLMIFGFCYTPAPAHAAKNGAQPPTTNPIKKHKKHKKKHHHKHKKKRHRKRHHKHHKKHHKKSTTQPAK